MYFSFFFCLFKLFFFNPSWFFCWFTAARTNVFLFHTIKWFRSHSHLLHRCSSDLLSSASYIKRNIMDAEYWHEMHVIKPGLSMLDYFNDTFWPNPKKNLKKRTKGIIYLRKSKSNPWKNIKSIASSFVICFERSQIWFGWLNVMYISLLTALTVIVCCLQVHGLQALLYSVIYPTLITSIPSKFNRC